MVRNTIEYAQLEAGKLDLLPRPFDVADALDEATTKLAPAVESRRQHVRLTRPDALPAAFGDPDRTAQVLFELLDNAAKYSPEGAEIHVTLAATDDRLTVAIADQGVGIPAEALPNLFKPFYQANFTRTRAHGGMGLGLAIAHHLITRMHGELTVASPASGGTLVSFWLPVEPRHAPDVGQDVRPGSSFS
jgi:signal transduction histidine kinase